VAVHPVVLVEKLDDCKVFVPRVLVEGLQCLYGHAHCLEVNIVGDKALLHLLVDVFVPDPLEHSCVEVCQWIPTIIVVLIFLTLLPLLLAVMTNIRPDRLSDQYFPEVSKTLSSIVTVASLPVEAHGHNLLEKVALVSLAFPVHYTEGNFVTLIPERLPPVVKL